MTDINITYQEGKAEESELTDMAIDLEDLLKPFSPTIQVIPTQMEHTPFEPFEDCRRARLESVLALQFYQHIAEEDVYRRCDNACGRPFIRQFGRSVQCQYRTKGVILLILVRQGSGIAGLPAKEAPHRRLFHIGRPWRHQLLSMRGAENPPML
jgi:hypothetical protein